MKRVFFVVALVVCASIAAGVGTNWIANAQETTAPPPAVSEAAPAPPAASEANAESAPEAAAAEPAPVEAPAAPPALPGVTPGGPPPDPYVSASEFGPVPNPFDSIAGRPEPEVRRAPAPAPESLPDPYTTPAWAAQPSATGLSVEETSQKPDPNDLERLIGRRAVEDGRGAEAGLIRALPQSCPPFNLRDEFGKIIDPTYVPKDENGNPILGPDGKPVKPESLPVDMRQTCLPCHDVDTITHGYHFQMGFNELFAEAKPGEPAPLQKSPGFYGKWNLLYQRELAPKHFTDPASLDMTPFDWVVSCGVCHPGGGPAEFDRVGRKYSDRTGSDTTLGGALDGDYFQQPWDRSGVVGPDCLICHLDTYDYSQRAKQIKKWNFKWAAVEGSNLGFVEGSVKDGQIPQVTYNENLFQPDGKVYLPIRRPSDRACLFCHDLSGVQKRGTTWHNPYVQDVHSQQNVKCIDCHTGDIRHNFAKGFSSAMTASQKLDGTMTSCQDCHYKRQMGAPDHVHMGIPPLHFKRMSCQSCHVTKRPFLMARTIDTTTGKAIELPNSADVNRFENYAFGATWGRMDQQGNEALLKPYTQEEIQKAAELVVPAAADARIRSRYIANADFEPLPDGEFKVADYIQGSRELEQIEPPKADTPEKRTLMLLALEEITGAPDNKDYPAVVIYRGNAFRLDGNRYDNRPVTLQPDRVSRIEEYPVTYAIHYLNPDDTLGRYYPEGYQIGVFWAYADKTTGAGKPLFLKDMQAAWDFLNSVVLVQRSGELGDEGKTLAIYDDNNDRWPEVNTNDEMALMGWAIKHTLTRIDNYDLFYIKGMHAYRVEIEDTVPADLTNAEGAPAVTQGQPYLSVSLKKEGSPVIHVPPFKAKVEQIDPETNPVTAELATRLQWTISHGIEPGTQALGLGIKGCIDCHGKDSKFFNTAVLVDPFGPDGKPVTKPAYELMGFTAEQLRYGHIREVIFKEEGHWLIIGTVLLCALHFILFGPRVPSPYTPPKQEGTVRFFRFYERFAYWFAAGCVTVLGLTAIGFRLTGQTAIGHNVRMTHHYVGIAATVAFALFFLLLLPYMIPRGYDFLPRKAGEPRKAGKFSRGEKLLFWALSLCLAGICVTGLIIHNDYDIRTSYQQAVYMWHDGFAVLAVCLIFVHMYQMILLHPQSMRRVFGGRVPRSWAETYRSEWRPLS